jgi:uncharacterized protein YraI
MSKRSVSFIAAIIVLLGGFSSSCATAGAGPQAWIDKPLDNTTAPVAPLSIIAHASHGGGVARMEFTIDGTTQWTIDTGGGSLVWQQVEWNPPGPGTYLVGARGVGADGAAGALATSLVTISDEAALPIPLPDVPKAAATPTLTPTPTRTPVVTITPITPEAPTAPSVIAKMNANCREGPGTAYDSYGSLLAGQQAEIKGRLSDNSWLLIALAGRSSYCWIAASVANVSGDLSKVQTVAAGALPPVAGEQPPAAGQQPPAAGEEPPTGSVLEPPPIVIDETAPTIASYDVQPRTIYTSDAGCASAAHTVRVAAAIGDDGGVRNVFAHWSLAGQAGDVTMPLGNLAYYADMGPFNTAGTMQIYVVATDNSGNFEVSGTISVTVSDIGCMEQNPTGP